VNVAIYVSSSTLFTVDKVPPTTVINELLKSVVGVLISNVTVAVSPGLNVVLFE
jgi:hypothetical protein